MRLTASVATAGVFALLAACSGSTGADGGSTGGTTTGGGTSGGGTSGGNTQTCTAYADAFCGLYQSCSNGYETSLLFGDLTTCEASYLTYCENRLAAPNSALTSEQIQACAAALPDESCENLYAADNTAPCEPAQGPGAAGSACSIDAQCQSAYCNLDKDAVCGTCGPALTVGSDCSSILSCGPGLVCLKGPQTCANPVQDGGACVSESDCQFGLACLNGDGGQLVCAPTVGPGQPCDYHYLTGPVCSGREGVYCKRSGDGGSCTPYGLADAGQPCGLVDGLDTVCVQSGVCQKALPDAGEGVCLAAALVGMPCDIDAGPSCLPEARCVPSSPTGTAGVCAAPAPASCP